MDNNQMALTYIREQIIGLKGLKAMFIKKPLTESFDKLVTDYNLYSVGGIKTELVPNVKQQDFMGAILEIRKQVDGSKYRKKVVPYFNDLVTDFKLEVERLSA